MKKQKPRKFKGWESVPVGVLVSAKSLITGERDRVFLKVNDKDYVLKFTDEPDDIFEFDFVDPDIFSTEKYREVIL